MPTPRPLLHRAAGASPRRWRDRVSTAAAALAAATLVACGGGGGVGAGGTGTLAVGSISGFGSVIVNGVRYDDRGADVYDDDGNRVSSDDLQLGMVVEVRGSVSDDGLSGTASSFTYASELKGPVTAVGADTITVFGQTVNVTPATVFSDVGGLAGIAVGSVVEVYGLADGSGAITATRIELEAASVAAFGGDFRVRGTLSGLAGTAPDRSFTVATVDVTTSADTEVEGTLVEGAYVSVRLNKVAAGDGSYAAERVKVKTRSYDDDVDEAELEGLVTEFVDAASPFKVNGYPVRLGTAVVYDDGVAGDLANGVHVEVEGTVVDGVLVARKVEFEHEDDDGGDDGSDAPFEFKGVASCTPAPCNGTSGSFVVTTDSGRTITVGYDVATTVFDDGVTPANLSGFDVEVKAVAVEGGTGFLATRIEPND